MDNTSSRAFTIDIPISLVGHQLVFLKVGGYCHGLCFACGFVLPVMLLSVPLPLLPLFFPSGHFCTPPTMADEAHLPCIYWQSSHYRYLPWTSLQCQSILPVRWSLAFIPAISHDRFLFVFLILSFLCFRSGYAVCLRQPRLCPALGSSCDF